MVASVSRELNLFRESVPMVPDAVPLPCWLRSHYYPFLFQEAADRCWPAMHPSPPPPRSCQIRSRFAAQRNIMLWFFSDVKWQGTRNFVVCVCLCLLVHIRAVVSDRSDAAAQNDNDKARKPRAHLPVRKHYSCLCLWRKTFCIGRNFNLAVCFFFSVCFVRLLCCCA